MNLNVSDNKVVKISGDKNYYFCDWTFKLSCICDLCVKDKSLRSPIIALDPLSTSCCFLMQLKSPSVFQICNASVEFDDFKLRLSVKNKRNVKCYIREYSNLSVTKNYLNAEGQIENEYTLQFLNTSDIQNCDYMPNGVLTINIEIFRSLKTVSASITRKIINFQEDMKNLQLNEKLSDITLVVGDRKFHVHKAILASRSSVFLAMFDNEMKEKIENKVVIEDVNDHAMAQVLNYMYTEMVDEEAFEDLLLVEEILPVAHRYAIQGLVDICEVVLLQALNVNNAFRFVLDADVYKLDLLKKAAVGFIASNAKNLVETDDFKKFIVSTSQTWLKDIILAFG